MVVIGGGVCDFVEKQALFGRGVATGRFLDNLTFRAEAIKTRSLLSRRLPESLADRFNNADA